MEGIELAGAARAVADDFCGAYLSAVGAPPWHERNLDGLWDSLTGDDINERNPPLHIRISGTAQISSGAREVVGHFEALIHDAADVTDRAWR